MSREEIEEFRRAREWWRRPDPFDPRNDPDPEEADDQPPSPPTGRALLKENEDG